MTKKSFIAVYCAVILLLTGTFALAADSSKNVPPKIAGTVHVEPKTLDLRHVRQPQLLLVTGTTAESYSVDLAPFATFSVADAKIAHVDSNGWVTPVSTGATEVVISVVGQTLRIPVKTEIPAQEPQYSFRHEVMPVLSKSGCNLGACHGYSLGKNGFKLSLRGADPEQDFIAITRDSLGRRVDFANADMSLMVAKPLGLTPHQGGVRFSRGSLPHEILSKWMAEAAPGDLADKAEVIGVHVYPEKLVLAPSARHRLKLIADYSDGTSRDVTRLGIFNANNEQYAAVDDQGNVTANDFGETAVVVRFERKFAAVDVIVLRSVPNFTPTPVPQDHVIDKFVIQKLNDLKILPSAPASDEEFLRRVHLDLIGVQPSADEVRTFLADQDPGKRTKAIDRLFERPEFVDHWSLKWGDLLQNSRNVLNSQSVYLFREWLRGAVASNMPVDEFTRQLLTAQGGVLDNPAAAYLSISKDANDTVERTTQVFCGVRMLCSRCHSHPMENWTQADYFGVASFFNQAATKQDPHLPAVPNTRLLFLNTSTPSAINPRVNKPQPPRYLGGEEPKLDMNADRRIDYAKWLTSPQNPYFARGLSNRIWSYFFHRGVVEPVDDVRSTNPPINPQLLDALTKDLVDHKFDLRHLMRTIVTSRTYQTSSAPNESNKHDHQNFSHSIPRRVPAEALLDSLVQATGVKESFVGAPSNFTASQLPDANVTSEFLSLFGKPQRMEACECERDGGSNMLQALHLINGQPILSKVANPASRVVTLAKGKLTDEQLVDELYLWSICRNPTDKERTVAIDFIKSYDKQRAEAAQDLMWALLNSRDFMLVH